MISFHFSSLITIAMRSKTSSNTNERKQKEKLSSKKKKSFKDPFLRELNESKSNKKTIIPSIPTKVVKDDETLTSRTAANKANIRRLLPKSRLQLPTHVLRSARTFAQCPSMSVVSNEENDGKFRQLPVICSRAALKFHSKRLGSGQRVDNDYRLGQQAKRRAAKMKIEPL